MKANEKKSKAFIFSYDAVISLMFVVTFLAFLTYYIGTFSYSTMKNYEILRGLTTALDTMISNGKITQATQQEIQGNNYLAKRELRDELRRLFGKKGKHKITIEIYTQTGSLAYEIESAYPEYARESKKKNTYSVTNIFSTGDYYGIAKLQEWN